MLVNSVSSVRFKGSAEDFLSRPGAFAKASPELVDFSDKSEPKKKSKAAKYLIGALVIAAGILAGSAAAKHFGGNNVFKILSADELKNADLMKKAAHYVASLGDWVIKQGNDFTTWAGTLFKSK